MVYGNNMQQQHPMTSIPREMQITQNAPMHQHPVPNQQSDIINLSYNQRDMQMPHPDLPQHMGLYPTIPQQNPQHNHILQSQQQQSIEQTEVQQQIPPNIEMQYSMENVDVNSDVNMQAENVNFEVEGNRDISNVENAGDENIPAQSVETTEENKDIEAANEENESEEQHIDEDKIKKEPEVDPNQCRVCKNTESLIDIFAIEEDMRICDIIMKMCSNIRIHERDFLPHMICLSCLGRLRTAHQFIRDVVATDVELRGKLTRRKRARKLNEGVVIIDCNEFTDSDNYEQNDDDDYQVSNAEEEEDDFESGTDSDKSSKRVKIPKKRGPKPKNKAKKFKQELATTAKRLKRDIVFIEADDSSEERAKKREKCKECGRSFSNKTALRMHRQKAHMSKKAEEEEAPFKCNVCSRAFKYSINLSSHMQMHKDSYACDECGRVFALKSDAKKHALNSHKCSLSYECNKCRRLYTSVKRYQKHRETCSDYNSSASKKERKAIKAVKEEVSFTGRDLFKSVAPTTTTYWSDSFSD